MLEDGFTKRGCWIRVFHPLHGCSLRLSTATAECRWCATRAFRPATSQHCLASRVRSCHDATFSCSSFVPRHAKCHVGPCGAMQNAAVPSHKRPGRLKDPAMVPCRLWAWLSDFLAERIGVPAKVLQRTPGLGVGKYKFGGVSLDLLIISCFHFSNGTVGRTTYGKRDGTF